MIVVDTSALMSIFLGEDDAERFIKAMFEADGVAIGAPTALEYLMVARGRRATGRPDDLLERPEVEIKPWNAAHLAIARAAFLLYGKGRGHPARLNFGDCMSYALAKALDAPLLYKGDDFVHTDIRPAL